MSADAETLLLFGAIGYRAPEGGIQDPMEVNGPGATLVGRSWT